MPTPPKQSDATVLSRDELYQMVWSRPLVALAGDLGMSGNGLAKICDRLLIPHPPRGFWTKSPGRPFARPPLPCAPSATAERVVISRARAASRRVQTRKPTQVRREQILDAAAQIIRSAGLNAISMKGLAKSLGVSEALIYTYFPNLTDLIVALARAEIAEMSAAQAAAMIGLSSYVDRARASAAAYLHYVARRGGLLQILLARADARAALRAEYRERRELSSRSMGQSIAAEYGLELGEARVGTAMLRAVSVRAGALLAAGKIDRSAAETLARAMADGGRERLIAATIKGRNAPSRRRSDVDKRAQDDDHETNRPSRRRGCAGDLGKRGGGAGAGADA
jgi:AcrR family transcriptional regulator